MNVISLTAKQQFKVSFKLPRFKRVYPVAYSWSSKLSALHWIIYGKNPEVRSNSARQRISINGTIDLERREPVARYDHSINAASTIGVEHFDQLLVVYSYAACNDVSRDKAHCKE